MNAAGAVNSTVKIAGQLNGFTPAIVDNMTLGRSVTGIGDLNNDLRNDVVLGVPGDNDGGTRRGAIYILHLNGPTVLSVPSATAQSNFNVYPNPVTGSNLLVNGNQNAGSCNYSLTDITGRVVASGVSMNNSFSISTVGLPAGSYALMLESDEQKEFHQVFIHR